MSTPTNAPIETPAPDITSSPTPTNENMDMPTPNNAVSTPTPTTVPNGFPNGSARLQPMGMSNRPNHFPQSGTQVFTPSASRTSGTPWMNQVTSSQLWGPGGEQFTDESSHLFSLYLEYAEKHDKERTENWIAGADGILVFTGLFATALATFVVDSYKSLLPDSGSNAVTILTQISQQLSNGSQITAAVSVPPFRPPTSAVWVNALWFLSLVISLFCALLATLQQYWARRYLRLTNPQCAVHKRARLRSFFAEGVERFNLPFVVDAIPTLIHISMFLFFTGLVISLFSVHHSIAYIILVATVVCGLVYMMITVMPLFYHNSPYQSPLSALTWAVSRKMAQILLSAAHHIMSLLKHMCFLQEERFKSLSTRVAKCKKRLSTAMVKAAEEAAEKQDWRIDARALSWTLDQSDEESELEKFVAGIPRFTHSRKVTNPMEVLKAAIHGSSLRPSLYRDVTNLLINASDPGLLRGYKELPASVQQRRREMCLEALYFIPQTTEKIIQRVSEKYGDPKVMRAFASVLRTELSWDMAVRFSEPWRRYRIMNTTLESVIIGARCMAAVIATQLQDTAPRSKSLLMRQLGITDQNVLQRYLESPNSLLLKILNHFLVNTAIKYIRVENTDILAKTTHIVIQGLQLDSAAQELRDEFEQYVTIITNLKSITNQAQDWKELVTVRKNAHELLSVLASLREADPGDGSPPTPIVRTDSPIATTNPIRFPLPSVSLPPPGDVFISMPPETPSGETHPLMPMPMPTGVPSHQANPEPPEPATLSTTPVPSRDTSSGDEESDG